MTVWPIREAWPGDQSSARPLAAWARDLAVAVLVGAWIGVLGPFGSYHSGPLERRMAFQLVLAVICVLAFGVTIPLGVTVGRRIGLSPWIAAPAAAAATCLPLTVIKASVGIAFFPHLRWALTPLDWCQETFLLILPIVCAYTGLLYLLSRGRTAAPAPAQATASCSPPPAERPRLAARLPASASGDILALQVEDHYVRIHTASGSHLVLMRLSDAIAEMEGVEGLKTHRSWWVARQSVGSVRLGGRGGLVTLLNGVQAPVARSALASVRAAGWG
jgi:hypothetical protein